MQAVESAMSSSGLRQLASRGGLPAGYGGTTYANLINKQGTKVSGRNVVKTGGNDEFDEIFKEQLGLWAARDDGKISFDEIRAALTAHDKKEMQAVYNSGDRDSYIAALEEMFKRLFSNVVFTSQ